jgi:hypothetical protein
MGFRGERFQAGGCRGRHDPEGRGHELDLNAETKHVVPVLTGGPQAAEMPAARP